MEDDRPTAGRGNDLEENEEDALPDWRQFLKFAGKSKTLLNEEGTSLVPFIPKRGEKDFEPLTLASTDATDKDQAKISQHQRHQLNEARNALYSALSSGSRHHSSKSHNSFTWCPDLARAACDNDQAFGIHFGSMGRHSSERKRLELLPEEALYLVERGAIELWAENEGIRVPMSVQQAWAQIIGTDELTLERYQVFANLKRLGYVLSRSRMPRPRVDRAAAAAVPSRSISSRSLPQWILLPFARFRDLVSTFARSVLPKKIPEHLRLTVTRALRRNEGRFASLVSGGRWTTYEQIFARLRVIPTGHDLPIPRRALPRNPSSLTPLQQNPTASPTSTLPPLSTNPYQPFYNVYKPITKYKKSDPPPPDFQLVIINATTTSLPDIFEMFEMFDQVPLDPHEDLLAPPPRVIRQGLPAPIPRPPRPPRPISAPKKEERPIAWYLKLIPEWFKTKGIQLPRRKTPSPYPRLKVGRRSILVAVVDNGTISMLRFSENEFGKLPWIGEGRSC